ncbi:MAG: hypothetical protein ACK4RZ_16240 [Paracoccaceae bacterium]
MACAETPTVAFPFDPDRLFADHASQLTLRDDGTEVLNMPGGVTVTRNGARIRANDPSGAVGCALMMWHDLRDIAKACVGLTPQEEQIADAYVDRILRFVAQNAYPPMEPEALRGLLAKLARPITPQMCAQARAEGWMDRSVRQLVDPATERQMDKLLATPRLPVMNPCL